MEDRQQPEVVLVVDDNPDALDLMARILEDEGLRVLQAGNGRQAQEILGSRPVDLVVTDVVMEPVDGMQLCRHIKSTPELAHVPVIFVTGRLTFEEVTDLFDVGGAEFIPKPFKANEFAVRVRNVLRYTRREAALRRRSLLLERTAEAHAQYAARMQQFSYDVVSSLHAWVLVVDRDLRLRFTNQAFCRYLGRDSAELDNKQLNELLPKSLIESSQVTEACRRVLQTGRSQRRTTVLYQDFTGESQAADIRLDPIDFGEENGVLIVVLDVTERWRTDEALRAEKRKLEDIVNGVGASLALLDRQLNVLWANKTFEAWFGPLQGHRFECALYGLDRDEKTDPAGIFTGREHHSREWAHFAPDGTKRYYRNVIVPVRSNGGDLQELVLVTQDLTEITLRAEQRRLLRDLTNLLQTTLDRDRLLYIILTCVTAGHALGFNRAFIFLLNETAGTLEGTMGVGPAHREEAFRIWAELAGQQKNLIDLTADYDNLPPVEEWPLTRLVRRITYDLKDPGIDREIIAQTVRENEPQIIRDAVSDSRVTPEFLAYFQANEFICVPLQAKGHVVGAVLADNIYSGMPLSEEQIETLELFAGPAGLAIENARTYEELKVRMAELRKAQDALVHSEKLATVGSVAARVAHEIRNPLVTIGGFARSIMKRPEKQDQVERNSQIIYEEVRRLERILADVMDFAKPAKPNRVMHNINEVVSRVVQILSDELEEKSVRLHTEYGDVPDVPLDERQIFQVLLNLVRNGIESMAHNEDQGRDKQIRIRTWHDGGEHIKMEVTDSGGGISEDHMPRLFEPFFTTKPSGTGLGLAVTRNIVLDHGGDIQVRSSPIGGTTFTLALPLEPVSPPHLDFRAESEVETEPDEQLFVRREGVKR